MDWLFLAAGPVWKGRVNGVDRRWLGSRCDGFELSRIAVFKFNANKPTCLLFRCLL